MHSKKFPPPWGPLSPRACGGVGAGPPPLSLRVPIISIIRHSRLRTSHLRPQIRVGGHPQPLHPPTGNGGEGWGRRRGHIPGKALLQSGWLPAQPSLTLIRSRATDAAVRGFLPGAPFLDSPVTGRKVGRGGSLAPGRRGYTWSWAYVVDCSWGLLLECW